MKNENKVLLIMLLLVIAAVAIIKTSLYPERGTGTLEFVNHTQKPIKSISVPRVSRAFRSIPKEDFAVFNVDDIGPGKTKLLAISGPADAFYSVYVYFSDGSKVEGDAGYVEPNCRVRIIIEKTKITSVIVGKQ